MEDFNFSSLHTEIEPLVIVQNPVPIFKGISDFDSGDSIIPKLVFRYSGTQLSGVRSILEKEWEAAFPNEDLNFYFVDDRIRLQYQNEAKLSRFVTISTMLSIAIASLGLLGLTVLVVNSRTKEIGIRKVMGASPSTIFKLLAGSFSIQLIIAIVLSIPVTYWLMDRWLNDFAYRISIGAEMFGLSALVSIIIAFVVICFHTLKASRVNPVESLRTE